MDAAATGIAGSDLSHGRQAANFVGHFFEMCVSMCIGGGALYALTFAVGPDLVGYADPRQQAPELSLLATAVLFTLPMAGWMRFRGMGWRPILEMSVASIAVAILFVALAGLAVVSQPVIRDLAGPAFCGPACVVMVGAMLARLDLYTGRAGHHMAHAA
jgi:hypothetical protein